MSKFDINQESYKNFTDTITSEATLKVYTKSINHFLTKNNLTSYDMICKLSETELMSKLKEYIRILKSTVSPNSIGLRLAGLSKFLIANQIHFDKEHLHSMFPKRVKPSNELGYTLEEIQKILVKANENTSKRNATIILVLASSGVRKQVICDLKLRDLVPVDDSYLLKVYPQELEEYVTFVTPETTQKLNEYFEQRRKSGEQMNQDSHVFVTETGGKLAQETITSLIDYILKHVDLEIERNHLGIKNKATIHGFRKFNNTAHELSGQKSSDVQKFVGHHSLTTLYYTPESIELYEIYKKSIPRLTISEEHRKGLEIAELKKKLQQQEENSTDF